MAASALQHPKGGGRFFRERLPGCAIDQYSRLRNAELQPPYRSTNALKVEGHRNSRFRALGLCWSILSFVSGYFDATRWPGLINGTTIIRVQIFGGAALLLAGIWVLPNLWKATTAARATPVDLLAGASRTLALLATIFLAAIYLTTLVNARDLVAIAFGHDRYAGTGLRLLSPTEAELSGPLESGIAARLQQTLRAHPGVKVLHLESVGGWVMEGEYLATVIKSSGLATYTATGCDSACVIAFESGSPRTINTEARLGFHSTSGEGTDPVYISLINDSVARRLRKAGASEAFITRALTTPASSVWFPSISVLIANHLVDAQSNGTGFTSSDPGDAATEKSQDPIPASLVDALKAIDPAYAIRLDAEPPAQFLASVEQGELPRSADAAVVDFASALYKIAARYRTMNPQQCVAVLAPDTASLNERSLATWQLIYKPMTTLLQHAREVPARPRNEYASSFATIVSRVNTGLGADSSGLPDNQVPPPMRCQAWMQLFETALAADVHTASDFLRTLRSP
jgi:hypothetical protein